MMLQQVLVVKISPSFYVQWCVFKATLTSKVFKLAAPAA